MSASYAYLFNQQTYSDVVLVITSEQTDATRNALSQSMPASSSSPTASQTGLHSEHNDAGATSKQLFAHRMVLGTHSSYFRAAQSEAWCQRANPSSSNSQEPATNIAQPQLVLRVPSPDMVSIAAGMVEFMYTTDVPNNCRSASNLLKLLQLADEYSVIHLLQQCSNLLQQEIPQFTNWTFEDKAAAMRLPHCLIKNAGLLDMMTELHKSLWCDFDVLQKAAGEVGKSAQTHSSCCSGTAQMLLHCMVEELSFLDEVLTDESRRSLFTALPFSAVVHILESNELRVASENAVMVVAQWWLEGQVGQAAKKSQQKQVLSQVRLPQLRPWMLPILMHERASTVQKLLARTALPQLLHYLAASPDTQLELQQSSMCKRWGQKRTPVPATVTFDVKLCMLDIAKLTTQFLDTCAKSSKIQFHSALPGCKSKYLDGLLFTPVVTMQYEKQNDAAEKVSVFMGLRQTWCLGCQQKNRHSR